MSIYLRNISRTLYRLWSRLLDIVGDIKLFKYPLFVAYDPNFFDMTGGEIARACQVLQPGDIVLRGYDFYLDSHFIDGDYSHGAICFEKDSIVHAVSPKVEKIHPIEFMECDRIAILRPKDQKLVKQALDTAKSILESGTGYDFDFNTDDPEEVYCFELVARCYPSLDFEKFHQKFFMGMVSKTTYLAKSFLENAGLELVYENNPRRGVLFSKTA